MQQFIYLLRLVARLHSESAWGEPEHAALQRHASYLRDAAIAGTVILAGRTREVHPVTFGLVVYQAANEKAAQDFMASDPAVQGGIMTAELHPFGVFVTGR